MKIARIFPLVSLIGAVAVQTSSAADPIAELQRRLDAGEVRFAPDVHFGFLPAVLDQLRVDPEETKSDVPIAWRLN